MLRRLVDMGVAGFALLLLAPVMAVIGAAIYLETGRPIVFRQPRAGRHLVPFEILKFRSMRAGAGTGGGAWRPTERARITRVGRILRLTKLDELPQLVNVLRGEMTLIGPRPELPEYLARCSVDCAVVAAVLPGLTDPVALQFRGEEDDLAKHGCDAERYYLDIVLPAKIAAQARYLSERTAWTDLRVLASIVGVAALGAWAAVRTPRKASTSYE